MVFVFYNKLLLRVLAGLTGVLTSLCAWHYIALSAQKLGQAGVRDALAIVSFLFAGWLVMLIAEVADNHYVRALGCLSYLLGAFISFKWIFQIDGPKLAELADGANRMQLASIAFWVAAGLALLMLLILVTRLIMDKANFGQLPKAEAQHLQPLSTDAVAAAAAQPAAAQASALPPIPVDQSPLLAAAAPVAAQPVRTPAPVSRLRVTGGPYSGSSFELSGGSQSIGRQASDILLEQDSQVSRNHASIETGADGLATLRDNGSTNGTWVNGQRVSEIVLAPGDELRIGTTVLVAEA